MNLLVRVARISDSAVYVIVQAGYLDIMLFLAKHGFFLEQVYNVLHFPLAVIRYLY